METTKTALTKEQISLWFQSLQDDICQQLETEDGNAKFHQDKWERAAGGGGRTRIIADGNIIEKGGVNYSAVHGPMPENILKALNLPKNDFYATGVSIVIHPKNPMIPIIHMNVRYFEMTNGTYWFGGGIDLTPHYVIEKDAQFFHQQLKNTCDKHSEAYYPKFKKWADDYFYIKHRKETRGIGGIFFDRLSSNDGFSKKERFDFVMDVGNIFCPTYLQLFHDNKDKAYLSENKEWQFLRRGRYVEFNLVWDKGTKFGLDTDGRTESILMSLPATANWVYNFKPKAGSPEEYTLQHLKKEIDWINYTG